MDRQQLLQILDRNLGLCGCGWAIEATNLLQDMLDAGEMRGYGMWEEAEETLDQCIGDNDDLARHLPLYWLHASGLVEHGPELSEYTLSELGEDVLEAIREYGVEGTWIDSTDDEPETAADLVPDRTLN